MANRNTSTDTATEGTVQSRSLTDTFHAFMLERARQNGAVDRTDDVIESQAQRIMSAASVDDIMKADLGGTIQCRDVPGTFWEIKGIEPVLSTRQDIENSHGYYLQMDATCLGGDQEVMTKNGLVIGTVYPLQTGAILLMLKLRALEAAEAFPIKLALIAIRTQSGNTVLKWGYPPTTVVNQA